jgi:ribosomal subunit interface protein
LSRLNLLAQVRPWGYVQSRMKEKKLVLAWNIVTRNVELHEPLQKKFRQKIAKLEQHLQHFPQQAVYLQIVLSRNPKKELYTAALNLRLPSNILRSEKSAEDPVPAFDMAVKVLLRELATLKSDLRHERDWQKQPDKLREFASEPMPAGEGPQALGDIVREMIEEHHGRLLYHVRRLLWRAEMADEIPKWSVDPLAVVDEVARQACMRADEKPEDLSYRLWFYRLARQDFERRRREFREQQEKTVPLDMAFAIPEEADPLQVREAGRPLERIEPSTGELADVLADGHTLPPDLAASEHDLIDHLHAVTKSWPRRESSVFELHFVEGFEPEEVAMIEGVKTSEIKELIPQIQARLRAALIEELDSKVGKRKLTRANAV